MPIHFKSLGNVLFYGHMNFKNIKCRKEVPKVSYKSPYNIIIIGKSYEFFFYAVPSLCEFDEENLKKIVVKVKRIDGVAQSSPVNSFNTQCLTNEECKDLVASCLDCNFNFSCIYGAKLNVTCTPIDSKINCKGEREFKREMTCSYCYQTPHWEHVCTLKANCNTVAAPKVYYRTNCTVKDDVLCLGKRTFNKNLPCNWTAGYKWSTAVMLSITLGGFGADRFYLGHWQEGIGKLFSFGGLGVWTLIDVILISLRYLGPADGSLYI